MTSHDAKRLRAVVFDLDGTLTDTLPLCYAAFAHAFATFGLGSNADPQIHALFGPSEEGIIKRLVPDQWQACYEVYLQYYEQQHDRHATIFRGIEALLGWVVAQRWPTGIVTAKGARSAAITINRLGIRRYLSDVVAGNADGANKPRGIRMMLARWDRRPAEAVYVGDSPYDMRAARQVGAVPIGAAWAPGANAHALRSAGAAVVFESPTALHLWLTRAAVER